MTQLLLLLTSPTIYRFNSLLQTLDSLLKLNYLLYCFLFLFSLLPVLFTHLVKLHLQSYYFPTLPLHLFHMFNLHLLFLITPLLSLSHNLLLLFLYIFLQSLFLHSQFVNLLTHFLVLRT